MNTVPNFALLADIRQCDHAASPSGGRRTDTRPSLPLDDPWAVPRLPLTEFLTFGVWPGREFLMLLPETKGWLDA